MNFLNNFAIRYNAIAKARPLTTNAVLGFIIAGIGDVACQLYLEKKRIGTLDESIQSLFHHPSTISTAPSSSSSSARSTSSSISTPGSTSSLSSTGSTLITTQDTNKDTSIVANHHNNTNPSSSSPHAHGMSAVVLGEDDDVADDAPLWNSRRTIEMSIIRAIVMGPFLQVYFPWLSKLVPGTTMPQVFKRVLADQLIGAPVSISLIFLAAATIRGDPMSVVPRLQEQLLPTWQSGASYWPFIHSLNFKFVPVMHQPVVAHIASIWWNVILSYRANIKLENQSTSPNVPK